LTEECEIYHVFQLEDRNETASFR